MRYNSQILQIKYKGYSISDILNMTADETVYVFEDVPEDSCFTRCRIGLVSDYPFSW